VTAFEAMNASALRFPSRTIPYFIFILYLMCTIGEILNIQWTDNHLQSLYGGVANSTTSQFPHNPRSVNMIINISYKAGYRGFTSFLNSCFIFSVLSASNTALYVSSRTIYGIVREMPDTNSLNRKIRWISRVPPNTGVPAAAIAVSAISFVWLPFLQLKRGYALQTVSC
jgi:yeast amino acid transporter